MTRAELTWYANTLAVDPTHRDAIAASERASAEISPKLDLRVDLMRQRGRDGLASIDRQRYLAAVSLPLGDENEFAQFGYMRQAYNPLDDPQFWGNVPFVRVQKKWDDNRLMTYAQVNLEQYRDRARVQHPADVRRRRVVRPQRRTAHPRAGCSWRTWPRTASRSGRTSTATGSTPGPTSGRPRDVGLRRDVHVRPLQRQQRRPPGVLVQRGVAHPAAQAAQDRARRPTSGATATRLGSRRRSATRTT